MNNSSLKCQYLYTVYFYFARGKDLWLDLGGLLSWVTIFRGRLLSGGGGGLYPPPKSDVYIISIIQIIL